MKLEADYSRMGRTELIDTLQKLRAHVFNARPTHWIHHGELLAAKAWERDAVALLGLDTQPPDPEPRDAA